MKSRNSLIIKLKKFKSKQTFLKKQIKTLQKVNKKNKIKIFQN